MGPNYSVIIFEIEGSTHIYSIYPESIFNGISKIGSFFAIIKLLSLISFFHQKHFEKKVAIEMHTNGNFSASDQQSD